MTYISLTKPTISVDERLAKNPVGCEDERKLWYLQALKVFIIFSFSFFFSIESYEMTSLIFSEKIFKQNQNVACCSCDLSFLSVNHASQQNSWPSI